MHNQPFALEQLRVASPCHAHWDDMKGDEQVRFCGQCQKNVYNLSGMSRPQAEALVAGAEGKMCIRFFRRNDGKLLTSDCPVGWREQIARKVRRTAAAVMAGLGGLASAVGCGEGSPLQHWLPNQGVAGPAMPGPMVQGEMMMGAMCPPVQPAPPADPVLTTPEQAPPEADAARQAVPLKERQSLKEAADQQRNTAPPNEAQGIDE